MRRQRLYVTWRLFLAQLRAIRRRGPCCTHENTHYGNCTDCLNTGHAHVQDWRCRG